MATKQIRPRAPKTMIRTMCQVFSLGTGGNLLGLGAILDSLSGVEFGDSRVEEEKTIQEDTFMPIDLFNVFK